MLQKTHIMNRFNKYQQFRDTVKKIARTIGNAECCPLGPDAVSGYRNALHKFEMLPEKWQRWVGVRVARDIDNYTRPVVQGRNGEWYSGYDMDRAMMGYSY